MKPPPTRAPEVTVTDVVKAQQPIQRPPGYKGPPAGVKAPWERETPVTPVPSTAPPTGGKTPFKGPPKEVTITYLPFTPKKPPPQMPGQEAVVPQKALFKPPPAPEDAHPTRCLLPMAQHHLPTPRSPHQVASR
eukprot:2564654-Amphidinium_carterae.1